MEAKAQARERIGQCGVEFVGVRGTSSMSAPALGRKAADEQPLSGHLLQRPAQASLLGAQPTKTTRIAAREPSVAAWDKR